MAEPDPGASPAPLSQKEPELGEPMDDDKDVSLAIGTLVFMLRCGLKQMRTIFQLNEDYMLFVKLWEIFHHNIEKTELESLEGNAVYYSRVDLAHVFLTEIKQAIESSLQGGEKRRRLKYEVLIELAWVAKVKGYFTEMERYLQEA
mmetsp:Transcript_19599/g.30191  ORF Transcript_19599/g.30191 Transcript_19599/m.30191 type:complete len:146 (+) Transcript_19599:1736-2173(+)